MFYRFTRSKVFSFLVFVTCACAFAKEPCPTPPETEATMLCHQHPCPAYTPKCPPENKDRILREVQLSIVNHTQECFHLTIARSNLLDRFRETTQVKNRLLAPTQTLGPFTSFSIEPGKGTSATWMLQNSQDRLRVFYELPWCGELKTQVQTGTRRFCTVFERQPSTDPQHLSLILHIYRNPGLHRS